MVERGKTLGLFLQMELWKKFTKPSFCIKQLRTTKQIKAGKGVDIFFRDNFKTMKMWLLIRTRRKFTFFAFINTLRYIFGFIKNLIWRWLN